jgi:hypothetical protein
MAVNFSAAYTIRAGTWTIFKTFLGTKIQNIQYDDDGSVYMIYGYDGPEIISCTIWKSTVPDSIVSGGYSQSQNDSDKSDFETNFMNAGCCNLRIVGDFFSDPRAIHRFGNMTTAAVTERLISANVYTEQASQAQRSIVSTSAQDLAAGTGAKTVQLTFLNSNYVKKIELINLNGTTAVNTVATDIRFIESLTVVQGAVAAGTITLKTGTAGAGSDICSISSATSDAFLCHHYVPAGFSSYIYGWSGVVSDDVSFKLWGQLIVGGNRTDQILDLDNVTGITAGARAEFKKNLFGIKIGEKCYIRITGVPGQATSTIIRATLDVLDIRTS